MLPAGRPVAINHVACLVFGNKACPHSSGTDTTDLLQKKPFDGVTYNAAGSSYQMQWNIAEGYGIAYQEPGPGSVAVAETMKQVHNCHY